MSIDIMVGLIGGAGIFAIAYFCGWFDGKRRGRKERMAAYDRQITTSVKSLIEARRQAAQMTTSAKLWQVKFFAKNEAFNTLAGLVAKSLARTHTMTAEERHDAGEGNG